MQLITSSTGSLMLSQGWPGKGQHVVMAPLWRHITATTWADMGRLDYTAHNGSAKGRQVACTVFCPSAQTT